MFTKLLKDTAFKIGTRLILLSVPSLPAMNLPAPTPLALVPRTPVDSRAVASIGFRPSFGGVGDLIVEWRNGGVYVYEDIPDWMHDELMRAKSKGGYMSRKVKPLCVGRLLVD